MDSKVWKTAVVKFNVDRVPTGHCGYALGLSSGNKVSVPLKSEYLLLKLLIRRFLVADDNNK
ncbi:hypothetical protein CCACVL1_26276 [Corchorus capsularis]|uniref:Uncharacterized protein n=1 Tax=Corchorus capsularis TaxID=210143 RepID=A0A1R3GFC4_COCAP|nr:hypothetical protein CCACVL1_26276 [Corchorus capsularis]